MNDLIVLVIKGLYTTKIKKRQFSKVREFDMLYIENMFNDVANTAMDHCLVSVSGQMIQIILSLFCYHTVQYHTCVEYCKR